MPSKKFEEYIYWLGSSKESNWNEYITEQVGKGVLEKFSANDWNELRKIILSKEEYWQVRSAASLGEQRSNQAIEVLKRILSSSFIEAQIAAASELDWSEVDIEHTHVEQIQKIIKELPTERLESHPEIENLLRKSNKNIKKAKK